VFAHPSCEEGTVNARARSILADGRKLIGRLPGASGISVFVGRAWSIAQVNANDDEAVRVLGTDLGLAMPVERQGNDGTRYLIATSTLGDERFDVIGPTRTEAGETQ
jgi:hypothetical protein